MLQGHLDMVCERDPASPNDPAEGRIALVRDGDWLTADGTTLGADDGVAIAAMMALVEDESLPHGPLELLMTVAEEVGLEGANALDGSLLTGSTLINLDSEEDGVAHGRVRGQHRHLDPGRRTARGVPPRTPSRCRWWPAEGSAATRASRSRSGARTRSRCSAACCARRYAAVPFRLVSLDGGKSRNAIPRDAVAVCSVAERPGGCVRDGGRAGGRDDPRRVREDGSAASR